MCWLTGKELEKMRRNKLSQAVREIRLSPPSIYGRRGRPVSGQSMSEAMRQALASGVLPAPQNHPWGDGKVLVYSDPNDPRVIAVIDDAIQSQKANA